MKKCLVISGGDFFDAPRSLYDEADFVVACDKGWDYAKRLEFLPDVVIGDFDSYGAGVEEGDCASPEGGTAAPAGDGASPAGDTAAPASDGASPAGDAFAWEGDTKIIKLSRDKDDSDTMAGVKYAIGEGCNDFTFICAAGGRFDHFFCNIQTLSFIAEKFGKARLLSENDEITVINKSSVEIEKKEGWSLSVFSLCDEARGITEEGTRWQLNGGLMRQNAPYGLSNEWTADKAKIAVEEGTLIIITSKIPGGIRPVKREK